MLTEAQLGDVAFRRAREGYPYGYVFSVPRLFNNYKAVPWSFVPVVMTPESDLATTAFSKCTAEVDLYGAGSYAGTQRPVPYGPAWSVPNHGSSMPCNVWAHRLGEGGKLIPILVPHDTSYESLIDDPQPSSAWAGNGTPPAVRMYRDQWCPVLAGITWRQVGKMTPGRASILKSFGCTAEQVDWWRSTHVRDGALMDDDARVDQQVRNGASVEWDHPMERVLWEKSVRWCLDPQGRQVIGPVYFHAFVHRALNTEDSAVSCPMCEVSEYVQRTVDRKRASETRVLAFIKRICDAEGTKWSKHGLPEAIKSGRVEWDPRGVTAVTVA